MIFIQHHPQEFYPAPEIRKPYGEEKQTSKALWDNCKNEKCWLFCDCEEK